MDGANADPEELLASEQRTQQVLLYGGLGMLLFVVVGAFLVAPLVAKADKWLAKGIKARVRTQLSHSSMRKMREEAKRK